MAKNKKVLEDHVDRDELPDFYEGATNNQTYLEPNCSSFENRTFDDLETKFSGLFDKFTDAKKPVLLAASSGNVTTYAPLDIKTLEKTMKPVTKLLEDYKHKMFCEKEIKDYVLDLEELSKSNSTTVKSYIQMVKKSVLEVPALRRIAGNETRELKPN
jgi:hypothetical protein